MADKPKYGGGALFKNKYACDYFPFDGVKRKEDANKYAPELSGDIECTKEFAKALVERFKSGETVPSQRRDADGQQVVKMEIAARQQKDRNGNGFFSVWWQDPYKKPEPTPVSDYGDDDIPF